MLNIGIETKRGILFVRLSGKLTKKSIIKLNQEVIRLVKKVGIKNVVFNLEYLEEIDSYGENALIISNELCLNNKGQMYICINNNKNILKNKILKKITIVKDELTAANIINS